MHELSIAGAVVDTALKAAKGRPVRLVTVRIGTLRMVVPDSLSFYFEIVARDTLCEGAELEVERVTALLRCPQCAKEWDPAPPPIASHELEPSPTQFMPYFHCPGCEGAAGEVIAGNELEVDSIEVETAQTAAEPAA